MALHHNDGAPEPPPHERRASDRDFAALAELLGQHNQSMRGLIEATGAAVSEELERNRSVLTSRLDGIDALLKAEIPPDHGVYHRRLIEAAARREAMMHDLKTKTIGFLIVAGLSGLGTWVYARWEKILALVVGR